MNHPLGCFIMKEEKSGATCLFSAVMRASALPDYKKWNVGQATDWC